jgi:CIC family chloride channel protein
MRVRLDWAYKPVDTIRDLRLRRRGRWILLSALIGTLSGLGAIAFDLMFHLAQRLFLEGIGGFRPPAAGGEGGAGYLPDNPWMLPVSLVVGGLISGLLVFKLAPEAEGHGTDAVIRSYHHLNGKIRRRVPLVKSIASAITIGSGGSAGREGPIAQIGAGIGSYLADLFKLTNHDRRIMMMAGTAGGIGSIFHAPLGAALFSAECLYSKPEFEYEILLPGLISAITGYSIYSSYAGWEPLFRVPEIAFHEPPQLLVYLALGVACALAGTVYPKIFYGARDHVFKPLPIPNWTKPAVGALALGLVAVWFPEALGMGYGYIQEALDGGRGVGFLLAFAGIKILATTLTISSGGSGGVFGPSLVIGGALGGAFGVAASELVPALAPEPAACILVGMGGFFAGVAKVPFASVIMVMELTGGYGLLVPSLLVAAIAYLVQPLRVRLYENQVPARHDSPAHLGSFAVDVLRQVKVRDCWEPDGDTVYIREGDSLARLMELADDSAQDLFPVIDRSGRLTAELSIDDIRRATLSGVPASLVIAKDLAHIPVGPLLADDTLATAARLLASRHSHSLLVAQGPDASEVLGVFTRRDLIVAYGKEMERIRADEPESLSDTEPF